MHTRCIPANTEIEQHSLLGRGRSNEDKLSKGHDAPDLIAMQLPPPHIPSILPPPYPCSPDSLHDVKGAIRGKLAPVWPYPFHTGCHPPTPNVPTRSGGTRPAPTPAPRRPLPGGARLAEPCGRLWGRLPAGDRAMCPHTQTGLTPSACAQSWTLSKLP